jgi:intracellular sulfur oxidation DsrE/DsrF family protein
MKKILVLVLCWMSLAGIAQQRINPVIKKSGGIFDVPDAAQKPDPNLTYNIVIELMSASENPKEINQALNNISRLINLHVMGGVPKEKLNIVVAIHGEATYTITDSKTYEKKYESSVNPNLDVYKELTDAGVKFFVCGQSILARKVERVTITQEIKIATSMLTVVTEHQLKGYAYLKF